MLCKHSEKKMVRHVLTAGNPGYGSMPYSINTIIPHQYSNTALQCNQHNKTNVLRQECCIEQDARTTGILVPCPCCSAALAEQQLTRQRKVCPDSNAKSAVHPQVHIQLQTLTSPPNVAACYGVLLTRYFLLTDFACKQRPQRIRAYVEH